jgi:hypothetical protein
LFRELSEKSLCNLNAQQLTSLPSPWTPVGPGNFFTTHHSWANSWVIDSNTWYYTTLKITPDRWVTATTTTGNDATTGGYEATYQIDPQYWSIVSNGGLTALFTDNYSGTTTWMEVGEASYTINSQLPSWLSFDPNTLTFSGTPTNNDIGNYVVR